MTPSQAVLNLEIFASIAFLVWFFYGPWQRYLLDTLRQNLFEIRDEIFFLAVDGKIDFRSKEYQVIRGRFNGVIRHAHEITWIQILAFACSGAAKSVSASPDMKQVIAGIESPEIRDRLVELYRKASLLVFLTVVLRSPVLIVANMISLPFVALYILFDATAARVKVWRPIRELVEKDIRCIAS